MRLIGIDPGVMGALAYFNAEKKTTFDFDAGSWNLTLSHCSDIPMIKRKVGKTNRSFIDESLLFELVQSWAPELILIEQVHAQPRMSNEGRAVGMGATSAFSFGNGFGFLRGLAVGMGASYRLILPQTWKRAAGLLKTEKDASRVKAQELYPHADLKRKKDHARGDAILIAHYGIEIVYRDEPL